MKQQLKKVILLFFKLLGKINTQKVSYLLINWGYLIKSEKHYNTNGAKIFEQNRIAFHKFLAGEYLNPNDEILYLEFGVCNGDSFKRWVEINKNPNTKLIGFDTFTGLPQDWGSEKKGTFSTNGQIPQFDDNRVSFEVGLIQDTLPDFLKKMESNLKGKIIVHIDVDLYNASLYTLILLNPYLKKGDIVIFDDFHTLTKTAHEFRAYLDYASLFNRNHKPLYNINHAQFAFEFE